MMIFIMIALLCAQTQAASEAELTKYLEQEGTDGKINKTHWRQAMHKLIKPLNELTKLVGKFECAGPSRQNLGNWIQNLKSKKQIKGFKKNWGDAFIKAFRYLNHAILGDGAVEGAKQTIDRLSLENRQLQVQLMKLQRANAKFASHEAHSKSVQNDLENIKAGNRALFDENEQLRKESAELKSKLASSESVPRFDGELKKDFISLKDEQHKMELESKLREIRKLEVLLKANESSTLEKSKLNKELQSVRSQLDSQIDECAQMRTQFIAAQRKANDSARDASRHKELLVMAQGQLRKVTQHLKDQTVQTNKIRELSSKLTASDLKVEELRLKLSNAQSDNTAKDKIASLEVELANERETNKVLRTQLNSTLAALKDQRGTNEINLKRIALFQTRMEELEKLGKERNEDAKRDMDTIQELREKIEFLEGLDSQSLAQEMEIKQLKAELETTKREVADWCTNNLLSPPEGRSRASTLESACGFLPLAPNMKEIQSLEKELEAKVGRLEQLSEENESLKLEIDNLKSSVTEVENLRITNQHLRKQNRELASESEDLANQNQQFRESNAKSCEIFENMKVAVKQKSEIMEASMNEYEKENRFLKQQVQVLGEKSRNLMHQITDLKARLEPKDIGARHRFQSPAPPRQGNNSESLSSSNGRSNSGSPPQLNLPPHISPVNAPVDNRTLHEKNKDVRDKLKKFRNVRNPGGNFLSAFYG